jgi:hypothetical protein
VIVCVCVYVCVCVLGLAPARQCFQWYHASKEPWSLNRNSSVQATVRRRLLVGGTRVGLSSM